MYAVTVCFEINPETADAFLDLMRQNARASVRDEPGCHQFDVCTDVDRPGEVFLYEIYDDRAAFEAHMTTAHFISFESASAPFVVSKDVATYAQVHR
ncbi:putative quinol monooxygenase [Antarctobacter heliothermus]|uniref:Quinol monooxygenase YgiN n=1 Tax=Antarctobacter heliothermus TaxID=74033 RepID=A0A239IJH2_9RHOB|nr:putative quinol monooxygenase [Antarctobacter heliothermus]SNS93701.1 Quinol monooxygenase YgiN [Antarctobacter heliothermus]